MQAYYDTLFICNLSWATNCLYNCFRRCRSHVKLWRAIFLKIHYKHSLTEYTIGPYLIFLRRKKTHYFITLTKQVIFACNHNVFILQVGIKIQFLIIAFMFHCVQTTCPFGSLFLYLSCWFFVCTSALTYVVLSLPFFSVLP